MKKFSERLRARMQELDMTQEQLARKLGITRGAVTHYLAGRRVPPLKQFQRIAMVLKMSPATLQFGSVTDEKISPSKKVKHETESNMHAIPVLNWDDIDNFIDGNSLKNTIDSVVKAFYTPHSRWYALRIENDVMTSSGQTKSFHEGDLIIIDPDRKPVHNDFVIALLPKAKSATFKQYVIDGDNYYLKPLNPQYPITQIDKNTHIRGVVVHMLKSF